MSTNLSDTAVPFTQIIQRTFDASNQWSHTYTLGFLLNGQVALNLLGTQHILRTNDICFFAPYEMYAFTSLQNDSYMLLFNISSEFVEQYCKNSKSLHFSECQLRYNMDNYLYDAICREIAQIIYYTINVADNSTLYMVSAIARIISLLMDNYSEKRSQIFGPSEYSRQRLVYTLEYINKNYGEKITLQDIATHIGIHPQYFSAFFKKEFGVNFVDYLNNFRVAKSMPLLMDDRYSITEIAQNCGFSDHKTYGTAFRKIHQATPSQYRKMYINNHKERFIPPGRQDSIDFDPAQYFRFFQRFWTKSLTDPHMYDQPQQYISRHTNLLAPSPAQITNRQIKINLIGRAVNCLQSHIQKYITAAKTDLQFEYLRIRDIFSDDLYIYYEDGDHNVRYNWNYIDIILDFIISIQAKPMMEIGFMPAALASKNQTCGWQYHPNVSFPKSLSRWSNLVSAFIEHCIHRYGIAQVRTWYFDMWTSPNLPLKEAYWYESQEDFFRFYKATWQALKQVDSQIIIGTPTFSLPSGLDWYNAFFDYCQKNNIVPDYVSTHTYCCPDVLENSPGLFPQPHNFSETFRVPYDKDMPEKITRDVQALCKKWGYDTLPIIATSWNLTFFPCDYTRDTCFMGPYMIYTYLHSLDCSGGLGFWTLWGTDDELYPDGRPFGGNPGLIDFLGLKKPAYYALMLYRRLGQTIIEYDDHHVLTRSPEGYQLLIYNFSFYDEVYLKKSHTAPSYTERNKYFTSVGELVYHHSLMLPSGTYILRRTQLDESHGSTYNTWVDIGAPQDMESEMLTYIQNTSIPRLTVSTVTITQSLIVDTIVPEHGIVLYEITRKVKKS